ncbi:MAG: SxtJ family membrane protein, partial [Nitrospirota bacterium]
MSLISDVREGVEGLDLSRWNLRKFGLMVGGVFLLIAALAMLGDRSSALTAVLGLVGAALVATGAFFPGALRGIYRVWMGAALAVGWFVSRVLLSVLFFLVVTPIGLTA